MRCVGFSVENYKSIRNSGYINIPEGFTVVVGRNNSGKSALLEAFCEQPRNIPRRSPDAMSEDQTSKFTFRFSSDGAPSFFLERYPECRSQFVDLIVKPASNTPSLDSFVDHEDSHEDHYIECGVTFANPRASLRSNLLKERFDRQVRYFKAERSSTTLCDIKFAEQLDTSASNLPNVLMHLQGNPIQIAEFRKNLISIFPEIQNIAVSQNPDNKNEIRIWKGSDEKLEFAYPLSECGTGVCQAIIILVAVMIQEPSIIVIDEPCSFLHPGAARALMEMDASKNPWANRA